MVTQTDTMRKTWDYLVSSGMTPQGAAGMMGNLYAESGCEPVCLERLCIQRYQERLGITYTSESYRQKVDSGTIGKNDFLRPMGLQYAWGLAQWTTPSRKAGLYDLCKSRHASIGDLTVQLEYLVTELQTQFKGLWLYLTQTTDVATASDRVLCEFECPLDTGASVKKTRQGYSWEFYKAYQKEGEAMTPIEKVISIANAEIGYLEKASDSQLDSKTANAGSNNYTKYWRDVYPAFQGQAWCACFVSWCMMKAFGLETAKKLLKHWPFVYCPTLAGMTSNKTPHVGDVVLFHRNGEYAHTGIVVDVTTTYIKTIEGNTSGASGVIPNGGGVCKKTYTRSSLSGQNKYFRPDYSIVSAAPAEPVSVLKGDCDVKLKWFLIGAVDPEIEKIQLILNAHGYRGKNGLPLDVDGELGEQTAYAIETLQRQKGFGGDTNWGTVAAKTWKAIMDL